MIVLYRTVGRAPTWKLRVRKALIESSIVLTTRVLIADDHELVRRGLRSLLESRPGWEICGEAKDGMEAVEMTKALVPDLILLDITMPRLNGLDAARRIRKEVPQTQILILSQHDIEEMSASALEAGARAYVSKSDVAITLFSSMEAILQSANN